MPEERLRILIAEDEYWTRENLRTLLDWEAYGLELLPMAVDGEDALQKLEETPADIVMTDINMPYVSGVELMQKIRAKWPHTVILVLSGYSDFEYVRQALLAGALDYLLKPIAKSRLLEVISRAAQQALSVQKERESRTRMQERLALAASTLLDRDFSQWLHDARRQELAQAAQAQFFEYEQAFSSYRLALFKIPDPSRRQGEGTFPAQGAETSHGIKELIQGLELPGKKLVVHDLYHLSHFLLISEADEGALMRTIPPLLERMEALFGAPVQAVVSRHYLSFADLRKAYDEARNAFLHAPCLAGTSLGRAGEMERRAPVQRLSPDLQRQLERAAGTQQRELFDALVEQTGLYRCAGEQWTVMELLHCASGVAWVLRHSAEAGPNAAPLLAMDNLIESLLDSVDRLDLAQTFSLLAQMEDEHFAALPVGGQSDTIRDTVRRVKEYIDLHYCDELSLRSLSERFAVDDSYLSRMFKQLVGCNLMLYLSTVRMEQAKKLIRQGTSNITEVAQMVGYGDYAYFSRVFKKLEGVSPRVYREGGKE